MPTAPVAAPNQFVLFGFDDPATGRDERVGTEAQIESNDRAATAGTTTRRHWPFAVAGLFAGLLIAFAVWGLWPDDKPELTQADIETAVTEALDAQSSEPTAASVAYAQIAPSLVVVRAVSAEGDDASNIGAGVVINEQGQILTANHVVEAAESIELIFPNGAVSDADIDSVDAASDIAILSASARTGVLVPATLGNPRTLQVGDRVYAVGNPLGLTGSISEGVISGLNRDIPFPDADGEGADVPLQDRDVFEDLIQFDAAVNQGSSGGPLLNTDGHVVGIVTALADPAGQGFFIGIGFAVPIDVAASAGTDGPSQ